MENAQEWWAMMTDISMEDAVQKYDAILRRKRKDALGNPIEMRLSFQQWCQLWQDSGHWAERGTRTGQYCMSRFDDIGHYELGNVFIQLHADNSSQCDKGDAIKSALAKPNAKANQRAASKRVGSNQEVQARKAETLRKTLATPTALLTKSIAGSKPCTIDGITIYPRVSDLVTALGKHARKLSSFRFVPKGKNEA